mgnify:CR=1 FL=1
MPLGKQIQLVVQDNGIGIPAHELPRVFDRGFTGSNGRSRGGSTGMGLYLEQGGFSAARRAHDGQEFSGLHIKVHPVQGLGDIVFTSVIFLDILYLYPDSGGEHRSGSLPESHGPENGAGPGTERGRETGNRLVTLFLLP